MHLPVRRLQQDRESRVVDRARAVEERGQRIVLWRKLLAAEQEQRDVVGPVSTDARSRTSSTATATPPFMSLAPSPYTAPPSMRPGMLACAGTVS